MRKRRFSPTAPGGRECSDSTGCKGRRRKRCRKSSRRATIHLQRAANKRQQQKGGGYSFRADLREGAINYTALSFEELKSLVERKLANFKKGIIPIEERRRLAERWTCDVDVNILDDTIVSVETENLAKLYEKYNVPALGNLVVDRPPGVYRWMYCQLNSASTQESRDEKSHQILQLADRYGVQGVALAEHCTNFTKLPSSQGLNTWFNEKRHIKATSAHNKHETDAVYLPGGTGLIAMFELIKCIKTSCVDFRGLGRWTSWQLSIDPKHKTRVVVAYGIGKSKPQGLTTNYQQHLRYIQNHDMDTNPRRMFEEDLQATLRVWRSQGERLLIFMDVNEHIQKGTFMKKLMNDPYLDLREETHHHWNGAPPNSFVYGNDPIDCVLRTTDVEITGTLIQPFSMSVGDHRTIIVDVTALSMIGSYEFKIVYPACRRLSTTNAGSMKKYLTEVESQLENHNLPQRLEKLEREIVDNAATVEQKEELERIDVQTIEIQRHAEAKCRQIRKPDLVFSEPVRYWSMRRRSYMELIKMMKGKVRNISNVIKNAKRHGIPHPKYLTLAQLEDGVDYCKYKIHGHRLNSEGLRRVHLRTCLVRAEDLGDAEKVKGIKGVIKREENGRMWYFINRVTDDPKTGGCLKVERYVDGELQTNETQEDMVKCIQEETEYRFLLAHSANITGTTLAEKLGYLSDAQVAEALIKGDMPIPDDVDDVTALILTEISKVGLELIAGTGERITVSPADFKRFWKHVTEKTSSSISTIHFGHYKAAANSDKVSAFLAKRITVIARAGVPPTRWGNGLQVMLEKIAGIALVNKLRAILLMEADYNFHNKWLFGYKAMNVLLENGYIPEEQFSQRESTAEDAKMDTRLTMDLSRQRRQPMGSVSADAANCYDRINHIIMAFLLFAVTGWSGAIATLLAPIQKMKFFQRTGLGDSTTFMGGAGLLLLLQGLCQGNGMAPAGWTMIAAVLMHCYKKEGFGSEITSPISKTLTTFMGNMFVDDTNLDVIGPAWRDSRAIYQEVQESTHMWGDLLCCTGGALKPEKCFWYLVDYECKEGEWQYTDMVDWELNVPLPDGTEAPIKQRSVYDCEETLGVWSCPAGTEDKQYEKILGRMEKWHGRTINGHLPAKFAWVSYRLKLWPGIRYGLATMATPLKTASSLLSNYHYHMLSYLGVNKNIKKQWRTLPRAFGGIGLFSFPAEQTICCLNMLVQHFGVPSILGQKFRASLECMQLEVGVNVNPLTVSYAIYGELATFSWYKSLWERLWHYGFTVHLDYPIIPLPRERDALIVDLFLAAGCLGAELRSLNRVRIKLQMLFLSDIVAANGRQLNQQHLIPTTATLNNSDYDFAREEPTAADWRNWIVFWTRFTHPGLFLMDPLGKWTEPTHRKWTWYYDVEHGIVEHKNGNVVEYYHLLQGRTRTRGEQLYVRTRTEKDKSPEGVPATVSFIDANTINLLGHGPPLTTGPSQPADFWEYLRLLGGEWMWDGIVNEKQDLQWLVKAVKKNTIIGVTDGSYDRDFAPDISGAGWLVSCTNSENILRANFYEQSKSASSYRGELLGLLALHVFLYAICEFHNIKSTKPKICCDNISALRQSSHRKRRVKTGASQADVLRVLRTIKLKQTLQPIYEHVSAHQDRKKTWWQLTLQEQFNCVCDGLAKAAVARSMMETVPRKCSYLLPLEKAAIYVDGKKSTSDIAKEVRFCLGEAEARQFYTSARKRKGGGLGWTSHRFNKVDWAALNKTLASKPDMYGIWLSKQSSGCCATRTHMKRLQDNLDNKCPNCGRKEDAAHLMRCPSENRTKLLTEDVEHLSTWLQGDGRTNYELAYWIPKYILFRGTRPMATLGPMSHAMHQAAISQDEIGWREFTEGKVTKEIAVLQRFHCASAPCRMNGDDWMRHFISRILQITHAQWIFRNTTLHDKIRGTLRLKERKDLLKEVGRLVDIDPMGVPPESRFLLEFDFDTLYRTSFEKQTYWVRAMKAARRAGRRTAQRQSRIGAGVRRRASKKRQLLPSLNTTQLEEQIMADVSIRSRYGTERPSTNGTDVDNPCNKRYRRPA